MSDQWVKSETFLQKQKSYLQSIKKNKSDMISLTLKKVTTIVNEKVNLRIPLKDESVLGARKNPKAIYLIATCLSIIT